MSAVAQSHDMPARTLGLRLQCPQCGGDLGELRPDDSSSGAPHACTTCRFRMVGQDGIWRALPPARAAYFSRFLREYQTVREAEGRGSSASEYYLSLPYRDLSGHNRDQWAIRARSYRFLESKILPELEARKNGALDVVDLGAGNGWMSYRLALRSHRLAAVDLLVSASDGLAAAEHYRQALATFFPRFQAELDRLPFADSQFDLAIFNASFHYSEDYLKTLGEAIRCLRPGGTVIIADTAWYTREESGRRMVAERQAAFTQRYGFPSDGLASLEYLTDERLAKLEKQFAIRWTRYSPFYGMRWAMRPLVAKLKGKREPSRFRIYVAEVQK